MGSFVPHDDAVETIVIEKGKDVLLAPHLVLIGNEGKDLCLASPSSVAGNKWCYDTKPCPTKTHVKSDKVSIDPGLYVKASGKGKLAYLEPHVPLKHVINKGYSQELLELSMARSLQDWGLIFQIINLQAGEFESLSDLEGEVLDLKTDAAAFKTPRKVIASVKLGEPDGTQSPTTLFSGEEKIQSVSLLNVLRNKFSVKLSDDDNSNEEVLIATLMDDSELLAQVVGALMTYAVDNDSFQELDKALKLIEKDTRTISAKMVELLTLLGDASNEKGRARSSIYSELDGLVSSVDKFNDALEAMERKQQDKWEKWTEKNEADENLKDNMAKSIQLFRKIMIKQTMFENELKSITDSIEGQKAVHQTTPSSLNPFDEMINQLDGNHEEDANTIQHSNTSTCGSGGSGGSISKVTSSCGKGCPCNCAEQFVRINQILETLKVEMEALKLDQDGGDGLVKIGGFTFSSRDNLLLWCRENLPGHIPVGCFPDVFSFLNRMLDSFGNDNNLHNLVDQHKLGLSGDDAITLESFQNPLPKIFGNANSLASLKSSSRTWIVSMPSASSWEDPKTSKGIRDRLRKQIPNIKAQVLANINIRLANHPVGRSLATICLESTITFVNTLATWISDTHLRLTSHGYSSELSWQLVTQVVHHVFTADLDKARNFVRDGFDTSNPQVLHGSILWGLFRTHQAMEEYMQHGFAAHPAVASQYLDFLVDSRGEDTEEQDSKVAKVLSKIEVKMDSIEKTAKEARSSASTLANGLDQLKTKVTALSRNRPNGGGGGGGGNN